MRNSDKPLSNSITETNVSEPTPKKTDAFIKKFEPSDTELKDILESSDSDTELKAKADAVRRRIFGDKVYIRGLIEFTNYCKNDCFIAEYVTETTNHTGIVSAKNRFSIAVAMDTVSDSEHLFYRAARTNTITMKLCAI